MVILDNDHVSLLEWARRPDTQRLRARLDSLQETEVTTTIVTFEEQVRGWMSFLARERSMAHQIEAYRRLKKQLDEYCSRIVLDFDAVAATRFQELRSARLRIGTADLKIAAVALGHNATLLSRNLGDFRKIPGLRVEDWTT